jgi:small subunit ribosomal protein S4
MGHPKKARKTYETPTHPWQADRLKEESEYVKNYGFRNKKEIWKIIAKLKNYKEQVKNIIANKSSLQMQKEKEQLMVKLLKYGLIKKNSKIEDVLDLIPQDLMEKRLQTVVFRKKLARSLKQARQFIIHGHILLDNKKITVPSYLVFLEEESKLSLNSNINLPKEAILKKTKKSTKVEKEPAKENKPKEEVPKAADLKEKKEEKDK